MDQVPVRGWVVDLRANGGGNMLPMLAGVGPLLGEGMIGAFLHPSGERLLWSYRYGTLLLGDQVLLKVEGPAHELRRLMPPVAVLTSGVTASSGEAVAVAFPGRPQTCSFAALTRGLPTANEPYTLSDGARLLLTVALFADRSGRTYDAPLVPDEIVPVEAEPHATRDCPEAVLHAAAQVTVDEVTIGWGVYLPARSRSSLSSQSSFPQEQCSHQSRPPAEGPRLARPDPAEGH